MKKTFLAIILAVVSSVGIISAQGLNTIKDKTFDQAVAQAKAENKTLIVDVFTDWCPPCKFMSANIFPSTGVESLNENFLLFKIDAEKGEGVDIAKKFVVRAYPTLVFVKEGKEVARIVGGSKTPEDFVNRVNNAMED